MMSHLLKVKKLNHEFVIIFFLFSTAKFPKIDLFFEMMELKNHEVSKLAAIC